MKYFTITLLSFFCFFSLVSCKHDPCCTPEPGPTLNQLDFSNLAVGQKSKYLLLLGEGYAWGQADNYVYLDDTLVLEVVAQDPQKGFLVEERLQYQQDLSSTWLEADKDSVYTYYLQATTDSLKVIPVTGNYTRSRIFNLRALPLVQVANPEVHIVGWMTDLPYCECDRKGFVKNYTQFGRIYPSLNMLMHNSPMSFDGPGLTFIYSANDGIVRFSIYSWWTQSGYGFDLLP
ncbi:MAG TPA: hypothetical protein VK168_21255 [Saprospiraceae bacterium]|nr:hypothetical protein [Saprospiraceae bacterium]